MFRFHSTVVLIFFTYARNLSPTVTATTIHTSKNYCLNGLSPKDYCFCKGFITNQEFQENNPLVFDFQGIYIGCVGLAPIPSNGGK